MEKKDFSKLRPFDLEAAKRGSNLCGHAGVAQRTYVAGPDSDGRLCVADENGRFAFGPPDQYRMAPLAWVEGKPVYKGNVLYGNYGDNPKYTITGVSEDGQFLYTAPGWRDLIEDLTWEEPKRVLCHIEGKPVHVGDTLYSRFFGNMFEVTGVRKGFNMMSGRDEYLLQAHKRTATSETFASSCAWEKPLCHVEGKPVFKGDRLYWVPQCRWIVAREFVPADQCCSRNGGIKDDNDDLSDVAWLETLTWQPPKVKREGFAVVRKAKVFPTKAAAEECLKQHAIPENWVVSKVEFEEAADSQ